MASHAALDALVNEGVPGSSSSSIHNAWDFMNDIRRFEKPPPHGVDNTSLQIVIDQKAAVRQAKFEENQEKRFREVVDVLSSIHPQKKIKRENVVGKLISHNSDAILVEKSKNEVADGVVYKKTDGKWVETDQRIEGVPISEVINDQCPTEGKYQCSKVGAIVKVVTGPKDDEAWLSDHPCGTVKSSQGDLVIVEFDMTIDPLQGQEPTVKIEKKLNVSSLESCTTKATINDGHQRPPVGSMVSLTMRDLDLVAKVVKYGATKDGKKGVMLLLFEGSHLLKGTMYPRDDIKFTSILPNDTKLENSEEKLVALDFKRPLPINTDIMVAIKDIDLPLNDNKECVCKARITQYPKRGPIKMQIVFASGNQEYNAQRTKVRRLLTPLAENNEAMKHRFTMPKVGSLWSANITLFKEKLSVVAQIQSCKPWIITLPGRNCSYKMEVPTIELLSPAEDSFNESDLFDNTKLLKGKILKGTALALTETRKKTPAEITELVRNGSSKVIVSEDVKPSDKSFNVLADGKPCVILRKWIGKYVNIDKVPRRKVQLGDGRHAYIVSRNGDETVLHFEDNTREVHNFNTVREIEDEDEDDSSSSSPSSAGSDQEDD